jgi:hypothetical protein
MLWVEPLELDPGILTSELPVDALGVSVARLLPGDHLATLGAQN